MSNTKVFLFSPQEYSAEIFKITRTCTFFTHFIGEKGGLVRGTSPVGGKAGILFLSDFDARNVDNVDALALARSIGNECKSRGIGGVFFDFTYPHTKPLLEKLCAYLDSFKVTVFVPQAMAEVSKSAKIVLPSDISGGSFERMLTGAIGTYGAERVCLDIVRSSTVFTMPSYDPRGVNLSSSEFDEIAKKHKPTPFFSSELCAKYFTYRDDTGVCRFVLFDDIDTALSKLNTAKKHGIYGVFVLYPDWRSDAALLLV